MFWDCLCPPYIKSQLASLFPRKHDANSEHGGKIPESKLLLPRSEFPVVDSHSHLFSTYLAYKTEYPNGKFAGSVHDFVKGFYGGKNIGAIVDVWFELPVRKEWKAIADSAVDSVLWSEVDYHFTMGVHPIYASGYTDDVEEIIKEAMGHPRCVGVGETGLDYYYASKSPPEVQNAVFRRQLKLAINFGKPLVIHSREAETVVEGILMEIVPKDWKMHLHSFSGGIDVAQRLLDHFPNMLIGITGSITYASNPNPSAIIRSMAQSNQLRIVLETDAPYLIPDNIYSSLPDVKYGSLKFSHSGMIPWIAEYVADVAGDGWDIGRVMEESRSNVKNLYGIQ